MRSTWLGGILCLAIVLSCLTGMGADIVIEGDAARLHAGALAREIRWDGPSLRTADLSVAGQSLLAKPSAELAAP